MGENLNFINDTYIHELLAKHAEVTDEQIDKVLAKASCHQALNPEEVAILLATGEERHLQKMFDLAGQMKRDIYGDRMVVFAPLYVSNYCVNNCTYCGYRRDNKLSRRRLTMSEIREEVRILERMGHKRLALEVGEDPVNCPIDYVIEAINTVYSTKCDTGSIRRINVNIAATSVEEYKKLKAANIGTYILFQETYDKQVYERTHPRSLKGNYEYHLNAFCRAMEAGIDDVGAGVLFGLTDWKYEVLGLMLHNAYLEQHYGVGFHTISVPRMKRAEGVSLTDFPYLIDDETFKRIVAILRIAVPFTGIILSTRESAVLRKEVIRYGVSQISAGSSTGVGGYKEDEASKNTNQFEVEDTRPPLEILKELLQDGYLPSYCTACYRSGRTGDRFMELAKSGNIQNVCQPNALMTIMEYAVNYGDEELLNMVNSLCDRELGKIKNLKMRDYTRNALEKIREGESDFFV